MSGSSLYLRSFLSIVFIFFILTFLSQNVFAHARWGISAEDGIDSLVAPRTNDTGLKEPAPCGGKVRTDTPKVLKSGDVITVQFKETIYHKGHFKISFSPAGDVGFDLNIINNEILHHDKITENIYSETFTLPNIQCDDCTLQLIQYMADTDTNYYSCADIQLTTTGLPQPPGGDVVPPVDISNLAIAAGDTQADLSWTNPVADFFQVLILQDSQSIVASPTDAIPYNVNDMIGSSKVIYSGNGTAHVAESLTNGDSYFFKLFAYDPSINYAPGVETNVVLAATPANSAPTVSIIAEQSQTVTTSVRRDAGEVIVQVSVNDPNPSDTHSFDWSATDNRLVDLDADTLNNVFTFDPGGLTPGSYSLGVNVTDDGSPNMSTSTTLSMDVVIAVDSGASASGGGSLNNLSLLLCLIMLISRKILRPN